MRPGQCLAQRQLHAYAQQVGDAGLVRIQADDAHKAVVDHLARHAVKEAQVEEQPQAALGAHHLGGNAGGAGLGVRTRAWSYDGDRDRARTETARVDDADSDVELHDADAPLLPLFDRLAVELEELAADLDGSRRAKHAHVRERRRESMPH